jgi:hypothetical protein
MSQPDERKPALQISSGSLPPPWYQARYRSWSLCLCCSSRNDPAASLIRASETRNLGESATGCSAWEFAAP